MRESIKMLRESIEQSGGLNRADSLALLELIDRLRARADREEGFSNTLLKAYSGLLKGLKWGTDNGGLDPLQIASLVRENATKARKEL